MKRLLFAALLLLVACQRQTYAKFTRRANVNFASPWYDLVPGSHTVLTYDTTWSLPAPDMGGGWGVIVELSAAAMKSETAVAMPSADARCVAWVFPPPIARAYVDNCRGSVRINREEETQIAATIDVTGETQLRPDKRFREKKRITFRPYNR